MGMLAFVFLIALAADHIDSPSVSGGTADAADLYVFQSNDNTDNMVFAVTLQGLRTPANTSAAQFDENVLIEFNIDSDGDLVEDLVIQGIPREDKMILFGPYAPFSTGLTSEINTDVTRTEVDITSYGQNAIIANQNGIKLFAGPRDDPFFFDLGTYTAILEGTAPGFNDPGTDTFAGTNVLALVAEVPKSMLGGADVINVWIETKSKI